MPEILIRNRLLATGAPTIHFPLMNPLVDPVLDIVGIGHNLYLAGFLQSTQPFDGSFEFHSIVGGLLFAAEDFALSRAIPQDARPTARAGIADTGAVRDELDLFERPIGLEVRLQRALRRGRRRSPAG